MTSQESSYIDNGVNNLECPICLLLPPNEVYQCINSHLLCHLCVNKVAHCPICRVELGQKRIRNFLREKQLDLVKVSCLWNECKEKLSRLDILEHEEACFHNPSTLINICGVISDYGCRCNFQFTMDSLKNLFNLEKVRDHLTGHHDIKEFKIKLGSRVNMPFSLDRFGTRASATPKNMRGSGCFFSNAIFSMKYQNKTHLFMFAKRVDVEENEQKMMSFMVIQLTPDYFGLGKLKANMFIKSLSEAANVWDPTCTATTTWATKPMKINEFLKTCEKSVSGEPWFPASMPIAHLQQYYAGSQAKIAAGFLITKN